MMYKIPLDLSSIDLLTSRLTLQNCGSTMVKVEIQRTQRIHIKTASENVIASFFRQTVGLVGTETLITHLYVEI